MTPADTLAMVMIALFGFVLGSGIVIVLIAARIHSRQQHALEVEEIAWPADSSPTPPALASLSSPRPTYWLAIKNREPQTVQKVLALSNPRSCSWTTLRIVAEDRWDSAQQQLFIAPPVNGWILVIGDALPRPDDDVDVSFRFLLDLSRKLGHVQFFQADRVLHHHAWVRAEVGRIVRAYAWANKTLWNQGPKTHAEIALGTKSFAYGENASRSTWGVGELVAANVERVPVLAARWSVNPVAIAPRFWEERHGIAGRLGRNPI